MLYVVLVLVIVVLLVRLVRSDARVSDLTDIILWYRKALSERGAQWTEIERARLLTYKLEPGLQPDGMYRGGGLRNTQFVTAKEAEEGLSQVKRDVWLEFPELAENPFAEDVARWKKGQADAQRRHRRWYERFFSKGN